MVNDKNHVVGDLPYPAFEPSMRNGNPTKDVVLLQGLYTKVTDAFIQISNNCRFKISNNSMIANYY